MNDKLILEAFNLSKNLWLRRDVAKRLSNKGEVTRLDKLFKKSARRFWRRKKAGENENC